MQTEILNLQRQIDEIKAQLRNTTMPIEMRETIRNEVIKEEQNLDQETITVVIDTLGESVTVPTPFTKSLILKWKGKEYKVPYYNV